MKTQLNPYASNVISQTKMGEFTANYDLAYSSVYGITVPHWGMQIALENIEFNILKIAEIENIIGGSYHDEEQIGSDNDDLVFGGDGNDSLFGGLGNDVLAGHDGSDYIDGGEGNDFVLYGQEYPYDSYAGEFIGMGINLLAGTTYIVFPGIQPQVVDTLINIENVGGSIGYDYIVGSHGDNILFGNTGNDDIYGLDGDDRLVGYGGQEGEIDTLSGGEPVIGGAEDTGLSDGQDTFVLGTERVLFYEGAGHAVVKDYQYGGEDGDIIQLHGSASDYTFMPVYDDGTMTSGDLEIYYGDDLIGIVENTLSADLEFANSGESIAVSWQPLVVSTEIDYWLYENGLFLEGTIHPGEAYYQEDEFMTLPAWDLDLFDGTGELVENISSDDPDTWYYGSYGQIIFEPEIADILVLTFETASADIPMHEWTGVTAYLDFAVGVV